MEYQEFLENKKHTTQNYGIDCKYIPDKMFDFQKYVLKYAVKKGRCAVYLDTGLGKTLIELAVARNYVEYCNKPVLIITPLAVAFQFVTECAKFNIGDIEYCKDGNHTKDIVVTNYERLHHFNYSDFDCVILDESSILKNFAGAIKHQVTTFMRRVKYRFLFTATPSPNDFIELGTSAEALGYMGYMDMLGKFFANNENNIRPQDIGNKFYLKPHAKTAFFHWVSSWSISMRKPSDLGFSDDLHILPKLTTNYHAVKNTKNWVIDGQMLMFGITARSMGEIREEQKMTINERCEHAVNLASNSDCVVYWCNFNNEGDLLSELDKNAAQLKGSMHLDKKEELLLSFFSGEISRLITKPKMTSFGLNWQHCNHTIYFPTFSYEQYYQSIRRFWRFGQKNEVVVDLVYSDGQKRIIEALELKTKKANELFDELNQNINREFRMAQTFFDKPITLPKFLTT